MTRRFRRALSIFGGMLLAAGVATAVRAEVIGQVSQPLVAGTEVPAQRQEELALIDLRSKAGSCSGTLLNNEWVISAAHCFKDPNVKANEVTVRAKWPTQQTRMGLELILLANDIAILRVDRYFDNVSVNYNLPVYTGGLAPGRALYIYGRGINVLASGSGDTAKKSSGDGKYRTAEFQVTKADGNTISFASNKAGAIPAGGDSGGPAFISAGNKLFLAGVGSQCDFELVPGKPDDGWKWVNKIPACYYASVAAVWPEIERRIGTFACRAYAWHAVGAVKYAIDNHCDPATISGPRWSPKFEEHLGFCKTANANVANTEERERNRISQECRVAAGMPKGTSALQVADSAEGFKLTGTGYAVNARVVIRATDSAGKQTNITSNFASATGALNAVVPHERVCGAAGKIVFTAEDQDKPPSAPVTMSCAAAGGPAPNPGGNGADNAGAKAANVVKPVDVYAAAGGKGKPIGSLRAGTAVTLLEPCSANWCHVKGASVPQGVGFVYNGADYRSLSF